MKNIILWAFCLLGLSSLAQEKREVLTLEDIHLYGKTYPKGVYGIRHMQDGNHYSVMEDGKVFMCNYTDLEKTMLFDQEEAKKAGMKYNMENYQISKSGDLLLIQTNTASVYRHSKKSVYYVWNFKTKNLRELFDGEQVFYATLSPNEKMVAFVFENNLFVENLETKEVSQITYDGEKNSVLNGMTDWVYEEEFAFIRAFEWSANSAYLAYVRFDETGVKQYEIPVYSGNAYPEMYTYKYPKAGEDNSIVAVKIFEIATGNTRNIDLGANTDIYIPRIQWINENNLCIQKLNRLQNQLELLAANAQNGTLQTFYTEISKTYIDITDNLTFLEGGKSFIMSSEKDGYNHLYHFDQKGKQLAQITNGNFDVTEFLGYDGAQKKVFYQSTEFSPMDRHIYSVGLNGKGKKALFEESGTHEVSFSKNYLYMVHTFSTMNTAPVISIKNHKNQTVRVLEDNEVFANYWNSLEIPKFEFFTVNGAENSVLNAWQIKPSNFNPNQKYPLLMFVYGGPGSQMVLNSWYTSNKAWFAYLAQQGYYVVCVDNRGTGGRGEAFKKCTYKNLGQIEVEDQIAAAENLSKLPYIDADRIGMFGWSYGGFMTSHCLARGAIFKTGVAVAPVTSWEYYDNIYTERYMQRPIDNPMGYENTRVMKFCDGLRDKNYLLVHGSFDDNVHPQNAFELMNVLVQKNIAFDSEIYVNKNHGIYGGYTRIHLFKKITEYFDENLKGN